MLVTSSFETLMRDELETAIEAGNSRLGDVAQQIEDKYPDEFRVYAIDHGRTTMVATLSKWVKAWTADPSLLKAVQMALPGMPIPSVIKIPTGQGKDCILKFFGNCTPDELGRSIRLKEASAQADMRVIMRERELWDFTMAECNKRGLDSSTDIMAEIIF